VIDASGILFILPFHLQYFYVPAGHLLSVPRILGKKIKIFRLNVLLGKEVLVLQDITGFFFISAEQPHFKVFPG
jgi:hypothetical protein